MRRALVAAMLMCATTARADNVVHPGTPVLDPPTLTSLGVMVPITGDDNFNATVSVRYRLSPSGNWIDAMPLVHVHAEAVTGLTVTPQFAGSIFDLASGKPYDIELHVLDADGPVDQILMLTGTTRDVPGGPSFPHDAIVFDAASLATALGAAQPGDIIRLGNGNYIGQFALYASGTADQPIVIQGMTPDTTVLDGNGCTACNVLEVYGSYVQIQDLGIRNASRALRFQTPGAIGNVVRRTRISNVTLGIGSQADQRDFYIADNKLEGRLTWPCVYTSDDPACNAGGQHGLHANDDGIHVEGTGHVITHNTISGFGDAMKVEQDGAVSIDFIGNDVLWTYDNGIELDGSARNTRALRNRFTNTFATLSFQPIFGGPAYAIRNVLINVADEQFKLHARGTTPTVGAVILHNTIVRATREVQCSSADVPLYFTIENNLFVGPATLDPDGHAVRWDVPSVATGTFLRNGFFPDGQFEYGYGSGGVTYPSFAALEAAGKFEAYSALVDAHVLAGDLVGPADWHAQLMPSVPDLASSSLALDRADVIPNVNVDYLGAGPDLGALERGCPTPTYGVRPPGTDENNEPTGCMPTDMGSGDGGVDVTVNPKVGGCCDSSGHGSWLGVLIVVIGLRRRR